MEVCGSSPTPELLLLKAQCQRNAATTLDTLDQAVALVHSTAAPKPYGPHYLRSLNPDLLLQLVTQYPESVSNRSIAEWPFLQLLCSSDLPKPNFTSQT